MDLLWAPWRFKYLTLTPKEKCIFCYLGRSSEDKKNLVLKRGDYCFIVMNRFPYNTGHLMVAPYAHKADLKEFSNKERSEMLDFVILSMEVLKNALKPDGFNIGANIGDIAGAGYPGHFHFHIVPRWGGDTNFMPVIGGAKVISQDLLQVYEKLSSVLNTIK